MAEVPTPPPPGSEGVSSSPQQDAAFQEAVSNPYPDKVFQADLVRSQLWMLMLWHKEHKMHLLLAKQ